MKAAFVDAVEANRLPRLVRLTPNCYAAVFNLMKLLPAWFILRAATERGEIAGDTVIVETTSGTFGLGLAMQAAMSGHKLILVGDPVIDPGLKQRLELLGTRVEVMPKPDPVGGFQAARLRRVAQIQAELPDTFCPNQYGNPDNPLSYALAAETIAEVVGQVDCLVGPVGSGGSMCGTATHLRAVVPDLLAIGVDTHGSVLFGQKDGPRQLRGLGNSLMPPNLDHRVFDEVHWLGPGEAYAGTRQLFSEHALFTGPTSGAAYVVARWWAREHPDATTVVLCPDDGHRYQDTVYRREWLVAQGYADVVPPAEPRVLGDPTEPSAGWTSLPWRRRSLPEVRPVAATARR